MGYCMEQIGSSFKIKEEDLKSAFKAAKSMPDKDYCWVKQGWSKGLRDLYAVLEHWRWEPTLDEESGDIVDIQFTGEKLGEEIELFKAIAPYVEAGSFIEMLGEDGGMWRWLFDGVTCKEIVPTVTW